MSGFDDEDEEDAILILCVASSLAEGRKGGSKVGKKGVERRCVR